MEILVRVEEVHVEAADLEEVEEVHVVVQVCRSKTFIMMIFTVLIHSPSNNLNR